MKKWLKNNWFKLVSIVFLLGALGSWPYGYYQILRWIVCGSSAYLAYSYHESNRVVWMWIFGVIAILFNPILPIYLTKEIWQPIDVVVAVIFFVSIFNKSKGNENNL